jgi:poly-gamma-glutamate capsule biosynthesis protein CapA/YwtB (metallophosphatase superfamily)
MLGTDFPEDRLPPDDGAGILAGPRELLEAADVAFGNLEGCLLDGGEPADKCRNPAACHWFRTPARFARTLADAGFDVLSLANNHAGDFGPEGLASTVRALEEAGIRHSGPEGAVASWTARGLRIALIGFAPNAGMHSLLDIPGAAARVRRLAETHDIVLVSFHGGAEGPEAFHVAPGMEEFYGEDRGDLVAFSRAVVDAGADLVIGHGPHVPRAAALYKGRLVAYSLGNFATWWGIGIGGPRGYAPLLEAVLAPDGRFLKGRIHSFAQKRPEGVVADPEGRAFSLMRRLAREDFGGGGLEFSEDGGLAPGGHP